MPAKRRRIIANHTYEICMRAVSGLPLPPTYYMHLLLLSAIARTQRDHKVTICHAQWMSNHAHMLIVAKDAESCVKFYMEIQKKITDFVKRLLGRNRLWLWEGGVTVCEIQDIESAKKRIAYFYLNPVAACLVRRVSDSPYLSTWKEFREGSESLDHKCITKHPWIRLPSIRPLPMRSVNERTDLFIRDQLRSTARESHPLIISPNAWMRCFGVNTDAEASEINNHVLKRIQESEAEFETRRIAERKSVVGMRTLRAEPIMKNHTPKKNERKIQFIAATRYAALNFLKSFRAFCKTCRECYLAWRTGDLTVEWPPGSFRPPIPPLANALV